MILLRLATLRKLDFLIKRFYLFFFSLAFVALISLLLPGCGISSYPYLHPPLVSSTLSDEKILNFTNPTDNDPNIFLGFEVYYKFYSQDPSIDEIGTADRASIISNPTISTIENLHYHRLFLLSSATTVSEDVPSILVPFASRESNFTVTINFSNISSVSFPQVEYLSTTDQIGRWVRAVSSTAYQLLGFDSGSFDNIDYTDIDSSLYNGSPYDDIWCSLYVLSYGRYDIVSNLYSEPVFLGNIKFSTQL